MNPQAQRFSKISTARVRYGETDQMGFAYHAHYLVWLDIGRTEFIRELGVSYAELEKSGLLLAVSEAQVRYAAPARYDDVIRIECWVERVQSRSITFGYEVTRADPEPGQRLATATVKLVSLDRNGCLRTLPSEILSRFREVVASV